MLLSMLFSQDLNRFLYYGCILSFPCRYFCVQRQQDKQHNQAECARSKQSRHPDANQHRSGIFPINIQLITSFITEILIQSKSMDWFLYDRDTHHERVNLEIFSLTSNKINLCGLLQILQTKHAKPISTNSPSLYTLKILDNQGNTGLKWVKIMFHDINKVSLKQICSKSKTQRPEQDDTAWSAS